tara:strand:- start:190 stop:1047 length:858 start_codon:yes stop_codon:yes gene_type:complete
MIKIINYFFQSIFIYLFFFIGKILGLKLSRKIFSVLFSVVGPLFKSKKIIKKNLDIFSHNSSSIEKKKIISSMWKNYGMTFIEYVFLNYFHKKDSEVSLYNAENLFETLKNKKPVIFVSGHFANFELMSMEITKKHISLATIYRPLNNIFLNPFMEYLRRKYICKNQIKKGLNGVREAIEFIKKNYCIALMIDQRVSEGERISFFKESALTSTLPAQLSMKYDIDIVPVYIERTEDNKFKIEFLEKINPKDFTNKKDLTEKLNKVLEEMISRNPGQWIWTHDRWK